MVDETRLIASAVHDFQRARRRAALESIVAQLSGRSADLLSYEEVRKKLRLHPANPRRLEDIPLDAIVGSVDRYTDFTRSFLPRRAATQERWTRVKATMLGARGVPPIEAYKVGGVYFVLDGNHRVSVAREMGEPTIQGYVIDMATRVQLTPEDRPDDVIRKAEYADFLDKTGLDRLRPGSDLSVTVPGQYATLLEHIEVHRYYMGVERRQPIGYEDAVGHWYDTVYLPIVEVIRDQRLLAEFPGRTETDLYLWISRHRAELQEHLGWDISVEHAAADLATRHGATANGLGRVGGQMRAALTPAALEDGPAPGAFRAEAARHPQQLFQHVLAALGGDDPAGHALDAAAIVARREAATLQGLHVVPDGAAQLQPPEALAAQFRQRTAAAGVAGHLAVEAGPVAETICGRSRWADLVVVHVAHPPEPQPLARLRSGLRTLIMRCSRPILCVPHLTCMERALLAYDGSPKAEEALFVATYIAARWQLPLVVVTVLEGGRTTAKTQERARLYLEQHGVEAAYVQEQGHVAEVVLRAADAHASDLIIAGGYGFTPVVEVVLGSAVDELLRARACPMLICR